jgi:hypothetical protein
MTVTIDTTWETLPVPEPEPAGQVRATLVGLPPGYLMHNPAAMGASDKTIPSAEEEAERSAYRWPDGALFLPSTHVYSSLCLAGSGLKYRNIPAAKRSSKQLLTAAVRTPVKGYALVDENGEPITSYTIDAQRAVVGKAGVTRARALVPEWRAEILLEVDLGVVGDAVMRVIADALVNAGKLIGVGDFRPGKGGPFGRFTVESFQYRVA